jgi:hypothetical protein
VIGLSFVMTLILMVIHSEPEPSVALPVETTPPVPIAARPEPTIERATHLTRSEDSSEEDGVDWVMQDARDVEELPADIREALAGCAVPRAPGLPNVISGKFKQAGQTDLAVLCVRGPRAAVYVFWGGAAGDEIATDVDFIPGTYIRTAREADIGVEVRRELPIEPGMPLRIRHDGIQLGNGCCATTHYWHRGRWRAYESAD